MIQYEQAFNYLKESVFMLEANNTDRFIFEYFADRNYFNALVYAMDSMNKLEIIKTLTKDKDDSDLVKVADINQILGG